VLNGKTLFGLPVRVDDGTNSPVSGDLVIRFCWISPATRDIPPAPSSDSTTLFLFSDFGKTFNTADASQWASFLQQIDARRDPMQMGVLPQVTPDVLEAAIRSAIESLKVRAMFDGDLGSAPSTANSLETNLDTIASAAEDLGIEVGKLQ